MLACSMRNASRGSAKIMLLDKTRVPDRFSLQINGESEARPCIVVRCQGQELGLKFAAEAEVRQTG